MGATSHSFDSAACHSAGWTTKTGERYRLKAYHTSRCRCNARRSEYYIVAIRMVNINKLENIVSTYITDIVDIRDCNNNADKVNINTHVISCHFILLPLE